MTAIASTVTNAAGLRALAAGQAPPKAAPGKPGIDEFQASSPDRHKAGYEAAYNAVGGLETLVRVAARSGQFFTIVGGLAGMPVPGLAGVTALVGGTYDVALGSSLAQQSAMNRKSAGEWLGNLQVVQGLATYTSVLAPAFGAPPIVGVAAAGVAAGAFAGRLGLQAAFALKDKIGKSDTEAPKAPLGPKPGEKYEEKPDQISGSRKHERALAFAKANNDFFKGLGGLGAFWTNIDGLRGIQPGGIFGILGFVGGTYSLLSGVSTARASAINRNKEGTVNGTLQTVQGLATLAGAMGMGRPAAVVAVGAWAARIAYTIYSQVKAISGDKDKSAAPPETPLKSDSAEWIATQVTNLYKKVKGIDEAEAAPAPAPAAAPQPAAQAERPTTAA